MKPTIKAAIVALALVAVGIASQAQAHHKTGHCIPGILTAGCPVTPQVPGPQGGN